MAKKITLKHKTSDGTVHTRTTARTYSYVIVATNKETGATSCPSWVGRPDLVNSSLAHYTQSLGPTGDARLALYSYHAEPINNGVRE